MKKAIYKRVFELYNDALYWIENKDSDAVTTIIGMLMDFTTFLPQKTAFFEFVWIKIAEIEIAARGLENIDCYYSYVLSEYGYYRGK